MGFDFTAEVDKALKGVPLKKLQELEAETIRNIKAREEKGECACGTPCSNQNGHDATDKIMLLKIKEYIYKASPEAR